MKSKLKIIVKKICDFCYDYGYFLILGMLILFMFGLCLSDCNNNDNKQISSNIDNVVLTGFVDNNNYANNLDNVETVYIVLDNVIMTKSNTVDKWVSVAPLFLEYDVVYDTIYLNYPSVVPNTNDISYRYLRTQLSGVTSKVFDIACYVSTYSSSLWSVGVRVDYLLDKYSFTQSTSYDKTVSEIFDNSYYLTNIFTLYNDNVNVGSFSLTQLLGSSSSNTSYAYNYTNIPINKIVCDNYDLAYFEGAEAGYNSGYEVGYNYGVTQTLEDLTPIDVFVTNFNGLMKLEIFPTFSIGDALWLAVGIVLFGALMKVFRF